VMSTNFLFDFGRKVKKKLFPQHIPPPTPPAGNRVKKK
jgi:hypothetical protein